MKYSKLVLTVLVFASVSLSSTKALAYSSAELNARRESIRSFNQATLGDMLGDEWSVDLSDAETDFVVDAVTRLNDPEFQTYMATGGYDAFNVFEGMTPIEAAKWLTAVDEERLEGPVDCTSSPGVALDQRCEQVEAE